MLREPGSGISVEEIELVSPGPRQVRVRVDACGVCHSDLSVINGAMPYPMPVVLGHEAAGTVLEVGSEVTSASPGDRVLLCWNPACGTCFYCTRGESYLCENALFAIAESPYASTSDGLRLNCGLGTGAFSEETVVSAGCVVPLPAGIPFEVAALVGCAVTTGVGAVLNTGRVSSGASVFVLGCGGVGLSVVQGARVAGAAQIVVADLSAERLALAQKLGATDVVDSSDDVVKQVRALTEGRGADYSFEVVGRAATIETAYRATRRGGTTVIVGAGSPSESASFTPFDLFFQARHLVGCVYGSAEPQRDFPKILQMYADGLLDLDALVTSRIGLDDIPDAFAAMERGEGARSVITPNP